MNTNMTGFGWFSKTLHPFPLGESSLSIGSAENSLLSLGGQQSIKMNSLVVRQKN